MIIRILGRQTRRQRRMAIRTLGRIVTGCWPAIALASTAVAADPPAPAPSGDAVAAVQPTSDTVSLAKIPAEEAATAASRAAENDPVVCKRMAVTGSRVKKEKVCRPQSEWGRDPEKAKEFMKGMERGGSRGVGGESLPAGG
jgi:hypothetical protein